MPDKTNKINRKPDWDKVRKEYEEWVAKIRVLPSFAYNVAALVCIVIIIFIYRQNFSGKLIYISLLSIIFVRCLYVLAERGGHKEGYIDGYGDGYEQGRDDAFGIDA